MPNFQCVSGNNVADKFRTYWQTATHDNNLTLHGFRRFKTSHLLNLRFLEDEIAEVDHRIYQAGLSLELNPPACDRLGLKCSKRDLDTPPVEDIFTKELVLKLRKLLQQYGKE